jgi:hypothetical protein
MKRPDYTVRGMGAFPIDMLRHDSLEPATELDGMVIQESQDPANADLIFTVSLNIQKERRKNHKQYAEWPFTSRRWESFGWQRVFE